MRELELLIPAGSLDVLKTAVIYGADAVYIGGEAFGLRAKAKNFTKEDMKEGIAFAHERGVKVYVTANILAHNEDLPGVEEYFEEMKEVRPDALIISDPGVFAIARKILPDMELHVSTQANNTNYGTFLFWYNQGAKRVVTARELSLKEIKEIRDRIPEDMEIRALSTEPCVFPTPDAAFSATILWEETPIRAPAPTPAAGSILWWRRQGLANICRSMRMRGEPIFSIPRICA